MLPDGFGSHVAIRGNIHRTRHHVTSTHLGRGPNHPQGGFKTGLNRRLARARTSIVLHTRAHGAPLNKVRTGSQVITCGMKLISRQRPRPADLRFYSVTLTRRGRRAYRTGRHVVIRQDRVSGYHTVCISGLIFRRANCITLTVRAHLRYQGRLKRTLHRLVGIRQYTSQGHQYPHQVLVNVRLRRLHVSLGQVTRPVGRLAV